MRQYAYKPWKFFALTMLITWVTQFLAAYFSYQPGQESLQFGLIVLGSLAPFLVGLIMTFGSGNPALKQDYLRRLYQVNRTGLPYLPATLLLVPASLLAAIAISVLFGKSPNQFVLTSELSLLIPIMAPTFEEIGWRGYGVDGLRSKYNLLTTSLLFALLWGLWHVPLFFSNNTYQHELWTMGVPYVANFFVSLLPFSIIVNWLYDKTDRSTLTAILFHIVAVICPEALRVEESTKFIQTAILLVVAIGLVTKDRALFSAQTRKQAT